MSFLKKVTGILLMIMAPLLLMVLIYSAYTHIDTAGTKDINKPIPWIIIITIFIPIAAGLSVFGYYAFKGEYDQLHEIAE